MKSRTSISRVHRPGRKAYGGIACRTSAGSRTWLVMVVLRGSGCWAGLPQGRGRAGRGPGLAQQHGEEDRERHPVGERLEGELVVDELARSALADVAEQAGEDWTEHGRE